jgi:ABC-type multidrug transport system fused ATPase/permease subunit
MVYDPIRNIVHFFNQLAANRAAMDRVNEVLENRSEIVVYPNPIDPSRVLGDLYIRLLKDEKIIEEIDEYLGILSDKRIDLEEKQRVKKFEEKSILPRGVKLGADENLGFKGNVPILLTDKNILNPIAEKIAGLVNSEKFRIDFKIKTQEKLKKGEEKTVDPILFIMKYLNYLTNNEKLIEETSKRLSKTLNRPINEIKKDPVNSIFEYINLFNKDEY